jgi:DNA polymerase-3 subunit gamma/tau
MHRPSPKEGASAAVPVSGVKSSNPPAPKDAIPQSKEPEKHKPEKAEPTRTQGVKPVTLEQTGNGRRKSALSLSSLKRNKEQEEELRQKKARNNKTENLPRDPFTNETFQKVWQDYIDGLILGGEKILASVLMADKPVLKGHMIHVTYPNQLMKKELLRVRPKVLKHLRNALNNHTVDFEIEVKEENQKRFAYTPQEKYELLKEKNSDISFLRKTFNLDL